MPNQQLVNYVRQQLNAGYAPDTVRAALLQAGYIEMQADEAITAAGLGAPAGQQYQYPTQQVGAGQQQPADYQHPQAPESKFSKIWHKPIYMWSIIGAAIAATVIIIWLFVFPMIFPPNTTGGLILA